MLPNVSVVIPVYDNAWVLRRCMDSVLSQTLHNLEVICIDDGSADASGKILDEYSMRHTNVTVRHQVNAGAGIARNVGLNLSSGEYVIFLDSDDNFYDDYALEVMYDAANQHAVDVVVGWSNVVRGGGRFVLEQNASREVCSSNARC